MGSTARARTVKSNPSVPLFAHGSGSGERDDPLRLVLYDPYPLVRAGLRVTLEGYRGVSIYGSAGEADALLEAVRAHAPSIAVVGVASSDVSELALVRRLKAAAPDVSVLVLADTSDSLFAKHALQAGARGLLPKGAALGELAEAIIALARGHIVTTRDAAERLLQEIVHGDHGPKAASPQGLSPREKEVFGMMGQGMGRQEIADELALATKTVDAYRNQVKKKLGIKSMPELMRHAVRWVDARQAGGPTRRGGGEARKAGGGAREAGGDGAAAHVPPPTSAISGDGRP